MSMTGKEKLYFLLNKIEDAKEITPKGQPLKIHATHDLNKKYKGDELDMLFTKLEKDEKVLKVLKSGNRIKEVGSRYGLNEPDDGRYHIELLPLFDKYFLKIQHEPEYQEFSGRRPPDEPVDDNLVSEIKEAEVKNTPTKIVISDLNSIYQEIESEKNKVQFFIKIAHYGKYILENSSTVTVLYPLYKQSKDDVKPYLKSWEDFVNIWKKYSKDLLVKAEKAGIKDNPNDPTSNEISSIKSKLKDNETSVWETDLGYFYQPYQTLIWKFKDKNKSNLLTPKHVNKEDNSVVIYPIYQKARDEWDKFKYSREASVWWAHYQICRLAAGVLDLDIKEQYFKRDKIIDGFYKFEFKEVARGNINRSPIVLHKDKYSTWIKRLHNYLIPRLEDLGATKKTNETSKFSDTATRRGVEKKWDVLQAIWSLYEASSRPDSVLVPVARLTIKGRSVELIDGIIEGLKQEGVFQDWERKDRYYDLKHIDHDIFPEIYQEIGYVYKKLAKEYQRKSKKKQKKNLDLKNLIFSEEESAIKNENLNCSLPPYKNEYDLCKVMFEKKIGIPIEWDIVYEKMTGDENFENKWRVIYDTMRRLNKRFVESFDTKRELFTWQNKTIKRNF
jgi:hypothetical protein